MKKPKTPKPDKKTAPEALARRRKILRRVGRTVTVCLALVLLACSLGLTVYPVISSAYYAEYNKRIAQEYEQSVEVQSEEQTNEALELALAYNEALVRGEALPAAYEDVLDPGGNGVMGYVEIPKISARLPIAHGTESATLEKAVGHLSGTALPVGGSGTNCVLTGHSGLASQRLFSDLDTLQIGDLFYLEILGQRLCYEVDQITTVLPWELEALQAVAGEDHCTLVTCTPFGVNTHRLLVRGIRVEVQEDDPNSPESTEAASEPVLQSSWTRQYVGGLLLGLAVSVLLLILALTVKRKRQKKTKLEE